MEQFTLPIVSRILIRGGNLVVIESKQFPSGTIIVGRVYIYIYIYK